MSKPVSQNVRNITLLLIGISIVMFYAYILLKPETPDILATAPAETMVVSDSKRQDIDVFSLAMQKIRKHEGHRFSTHNEDRGGVSKFGISKKAYPTLRIETLTWNDACKIYKRDYWHRYKINHIKYPQIAVKIMDITVNMGPSRTYKIVRSALARQGVTVHSKHLNQETIRAINQAEPIRLLADLRGESSAFYRRLAMRDESQSKFLRGWLRRARA